MFKRLAQGSVRRIWNRAVDGGRLRAYGPAALTLLVGVAASFLFFQLLKVRDEQTATYTFGERAKTYIRAIEKVLDAKINAVQWSAAALEISTAPTEEVFERYLAVLPKDQGETLTLCWAPAGRVWDAGGENRPSRKARGADTADSEPLGEESFPISAVYSMEQDTSHENLLGYDLAQDLDARRYLAFAKETGKTFIVSNSLPIKELMGPTAVLVVSAVRAGDTPSADSVASRDRFAGFVVGVFRIDEVVDVVMATLNRELVNLHVFDAFAPSAQMALYHRMAESGATAEKPVDESEILTLDRMHYIGAVELASTRRWIFVCTPTDVQLGEAYTWQPFLGLLAGLSLTAVVCEHFLAQIRQRRKAEALVQRRTSELQRTNERLSTEITARKQFEAERDELMELLEQSNETLRRLNDRLAISNSDLQDFAVVASHDLKEPLRKVRVLAEDLHKILGDGSPERAQEYIELIESCAARMQSLITNILQVSRVTTHGSPFTRVDLAEVAQDVVGDLAVRIRETGGEIQIEPLPVIEADPMQMRQLLQNLIDNGLKYGKNAAVPTVRVYSSGAKHMDEQNGYCEIYVEDDGPGINAGNAERVFALFQRVGGDGGGEGSGVGLAVCRKIAERHGGSIRVECADFRGTRFRVVLPVIQTGELNSISPRERRRDPDGDG